MGNEYPRRENTAGFGETISLGGLRVIGSDNGVRPATMVWIGVKGQREHDDKPIVLADPQDPRVVV